MRILEVLFTLQSGGAERFVVDLSNELSKNNEVILLTLKDDKVDKENRNFYKFDLSERVKYVNLGLPDGFSLKSQWRVYKIMKELHPDVVHLNAKSMAQFCILPIFLLNNKMRFFQTIHNDLHNGYDRGFNKFVFHTLGRTHRMKFIALSDKNYDDMTSYYPESEFRCIVNGRSPIVKTTLFDRVKQEVDAYRETAQTKIFLHIARFNEQKNQSLLIKAFNVLNNKNIDVQLLIIGAGFDSTAGQRLLNESNSNTHFLGTRKNVSDYMLNADIFCLSSIFEGMPITLLEASLAGVPCVSTPVCGSVDLIKDGQNGYLSKDFTVEEYVKALIMAIAHFSHLKECAMTMREKTPYTIKECAKKYMDYFVGL